MDFMTPLQMTPLQIIWCVIAITRVLNLAARNTLTWYAVVDAYLLAIAMYILARG
jgi:hypothetical protein